MDQELLEGCLSPPPVIVGVGGATKSLTDVVLAGMRVLSLDAGEIPRIS